MLKSSFDIITPVQTVKRMKPKAKPQSNKFLSQSKLSSLSKDAFTDVLEKTYVDETSVPASNSASSSAFKRVSVETSKKSIVPNSQVEKLTGMISSESLIQSKNCENGIVTFENRSIDKINSTR